MRLRFIKQLVVLVCFISAAPVFATDSAGDKASILHPKGLLWKIEKPDLRPSYIYGTMHVSHKDVVNLAAPVEKAFMNTERFAMEVLLDAKAYDIVASRTLFKNGRTLKDVMSPGDYKKLAAFMLTQFSMTEEIFSTMKPWVLFTLLMTPPEEWGKDNSALDMVLYRRAESRKIPLLGLETIEEQLDVLDGLTLKEQIWMLNKTVAEYEEIEKQFAVMYDAYLRRDLAGLFLMQQDSMYEESDIDDKFMVQLIDVRNHRMVERMQVYLQQGNAFIAVGALHLPGEKGILHLLELQGFSVKAVY